MVFRFYQNRIGRPFKRRNSVRFHFENVTLKRDKSFEMFTIRAIKKYTNFVSIPSVYRSYVVSTIFYTKSWRRVTWIIVYVYQNIHARSWSAYIPIYIVLPLLSDGRYPKIMFGDLYPPRPHSQ